MVKRSRIQGILFLLTAICWFSITVVKAQIDVKTGSYLVNMGVTPQTVGNGLKPYGMVYELVRNFRLPVYWYVNPTKVKDGVDLTHNGVQYKTGVFIIPSFFLTDEVKNRITYWQGLGVVGNYSVSEFQLSANDVFVIRAVPRWTLDKQNGSIAVGYFNNAGIPSKAYGGSSSANWKNPSNLNCCDDIFVMPHADPAWDTHARLFSWNEECKGFLWAACHAGSAVENMVNPANRSQQTNFLSQKDPAFTATTGDYANSNSLLLWGVHDDGSPAASGYSTRLPSELVAQYIGSIAAATQNGSEQIYIPRQGALSRWNPQAKVLEYDPTQANVPSPDLTNFTNVAAALVYGRGFDDPNRGYVMYEAGHTHNKATDPANVAAQRAMFNLSFLSVSDKTVAPDISKLPQVVKSGEDNVFKIVFPPGTNKSDFVFEWSASCGGTFYPDPFQDSVVYVPPAVLVGEECIVGATISDLCGRVSSDYRIITVEANPAWTITKSGVSSSFDYVGEEVHFTISVQNTGDVKISDVVVSDPGAAFPPEYVSGDIKNDLVMDPGEIWNYTAYHIATQADIDAGQYINTATATGVPAGGVLNPVSDTARVPAVQSPLLELTKEVIEGFTYNEEGDTSLYFYVCTNTGNVTLPGQFTLSDDKIPGIAAVSGPLAPGQSVFFNAYYVTTENDITAESVENEAYVTTPYQGNTVTSNFASAIVYLDKADLSLEKSVNNPRPNVGETITFTITVYNDGPNAATNVDVEDYVPNGYTNISNISGDGYFDPISGSVVWTGLSVLRPAILTFDAEVLPPLEGTDYENYVQVTASDQYDPDSTPANDSFDEDDDDTVLVDPKVADLQVIKTQIDGSILPLLNPPLSIASLLPLDPPQVVAGTKIYYFLRFENLGPDSSYSDLITEHLPANLLNPEYSLNFGDSWIPVPAPNTRFFPNFPTSPGFLNLLVRGNVPPSATGTLINTVDIYSSVTYDPDLTNNADTVESEVIGEADLLLRKQELIAPVEIGGMIDYQIDIYNIGPSDARDVVIMDAIDPAVISNTEYSINNGMTWTPGWTGSYAVGTLPLAGNFRLRIRGTLVDASPEPNVNPIPNTGIVSASTYDPNPENNQETILTPLNVKADLSITKTGPEFICAGDTAEYSIIVTNNSNTFASKGVQIVEVFDVLNFDQVDYSDDGGMTWQNWDEEYGQYDLADSLSPLQSFELKFRFRIKPSVLPTDLVNMAFVESDFTPEDDLSNNQANFTMEILNCSDLEITKTLLTQPEEVIAGEEVEFVLYYTNHGPSDAQNVVISDPLPAGINPPFTYSTCNTGIYLPYTGTFNAGTVTVGGSCVVNIRGVIDPDYIGNMINIACIDTDAIDDVNDNNCDTLEFLVYNPSVDLVKTADKTVNVKAGETVTYSFVVTNTGNATLSNVQVQDIHTGTGLLSPVTPGQVASLDPGESTTFTATYLVSQEDIDDDMPIRDTATVTSYYIGREYTDTDEEEVDLEDPAPDIAILKDGEWIDDNDSGYPDPQEKIQYTFTVTNTGNVTLHDVVVTDPLVTVNCGAFSGVLAPGQSKECTASYSLTQLDIDAGLKENIATVSAKDPKDNPLTKKDTVIVDLPQNTLVSFIKKGSNLSLRLDNQASVGDTITFTYVMTNSGNVSLYNVKLDEFYFTGTGDIPQAFFVSANKGSLEGTLKVGESATYRAYYPITQSDINTGFVDNQGVATADGPSVLNGLKGGDTSSSPTQGRKHREGTQDLSDSSNQNDPNETGVPSDPNGDDPTNTFVPHDGKIGVAKSVVSVTKLPNSNFDVRYRIRVGNPGNLILEYLTHSDDLSAQLGSAYVAVKGTPTVSVFSGSPVLPNLSNNVPLQFFDGNSGLLNPGDVITVEFVVEINPDATGAPLPMLNQVLAGGIPTDGTGEILINQKSVTGGPYVAGDITDLSDSGTQVDGNNPGQPGDTGGPDDPTPVVIPSIDVSKSVIKVKNATSKVSGNQDVTYRFILQNTGNVDISNVDLIDPIRTELAPVWVAIRSMPAIKSGNAQVMPVLNTLFDGLTQANIFNGTSGYFKPGQLVEVQMTVELNPNADPTYPALFNQAVANGTGLLPGGLTTRVTDLSDDGFKPQGPNPEWPGDTGGPDDPTPLILPVISAVKYVQGYLPAASGTIGRYDVVMRFGLKNVGNVALTKLKMLDTLELPKYLGTAYAGVAPGYQPVILNSTATTNPTLNPSYNGRASQPNMFNGTTGVLKPGEVINIEVRFEVNALAAGAPSVLWNRVTVEGEGTKGNGTPYLDTLGREIVTRDDSDAGRQHESTNPNEPEDEGEDDDDTRIESLGNLGDFVWEDRNGDGLQTPGEPGISGVVVKLYSSNKVLLQTTTTNASGQFVFTSLSNGAYYLHFTPPANYIATFANRPNENLDSDLDKGNGPNTTSTFQMLSGNKLDVDAGFYRCVPVGDLVWYDINKNDIWNTNENGINNIEVRLWRNHFGSWLLWNVAYTGPKPGSPSDDGYFNFCAPPGQYYFEVIMPPLGLVRAKPNVGNNEEIDSDLTNAFGNATSDVFNLVSGTSKQDFGAGFYPMAVAGNLVWRDDNLNGVQDVGEAKVSGVKVEAYDATSGQKLAETVTNSDGVYKIDYLEKRDIYMKFTPPAGFGATYPRMSADDVDSDVDHTYGLYTTRMFSMQSGVNNPNIDMGLAFGVLPVDWVDVSVSNVSNGHLVSWITAREVNVSHYIVERKLDIEKDFKVISVNIPSLGIRSGNSQYSFMDEDLKGPGVYVYRIRQVDLDGTDSYSKWVKISRSGAKVISLYPNPAKNSASVQVVVSEDADVKIELLDASSRLVKEIRANGLQLAGEELYQIDLQTISSGVYTVKVTVDGVQDNLKLIRIE